MSISMKDIKDEIKRSATSKGKFFYPQEGEEYRIRFLTDFLDGVKVEWHNDYKKGVNVPCQETFGRECEYCDDEIKTRTHYCWSAFNCETGEVIIIKFPVNQCTPVSAFASFYEEYGTLTDRDYKIKQLGSGTSKTFSVIPLAVRPMKKKIKPLSDSAILKYIDKAFPADNNEIDDGEDEMPRRKSSNSKRSNTKSKNKYINEPENDEEWEEEEEDGKIDYSSMKPKELFNECKDRGIQCKPRKSSQYYIDLLEQHDAENDEEWEDGGEEDDELPFS